MILSASRRTDLPAWHIDWLLAGLRRGWVEIPNPFRPTQISRISLRPEDVDAVFFWTRDIRPMLPHLDDPSVSQLRSVFLYTITGYGEPLEPRIPPWEVATASLRALSARVGPARVVWRYDPMILGDGLLSPASHRARFRDLARALEGATERVVISLIDWYRKTERAMKPHLLGREPPGAQRTGPVDPSLLDLIRDLRDTATDHGIEAAGCCEPEWHERALLPGGSCVDGELLRRLWGLEVPGLRDPGQRKACRCAPSRDIGRYDTCSGGCRYCYATLAPRNDCL
ncbi:MAG: DUF1848 domain-containing protein [Pseudomonadota bacterium]